MLPIKIGYVIERKTRWGTWAVWEVLGGLDEAAARKTFSAAIARYPGIEMRMLYIMSTKLESTAQDERERRLMFYLTEQHVIQIKTRWGTWEIWKVLTGLDEASARQQFAAAIASHPKIAMRLLYLVSTQLDRTLGS